MIEIPVRVCGDHWLNPQELNQKFPHDNSQSLVLRLSGEGPSLWATGVVEAVLALCEQRGRAPGTVWVGDWSNAVEETPFARFTVHNLSHFFWMSDSYRVPQIPTSLKPKWFGYFMGRANLHRARILQDLVHNHADHTVFSVMRGSGLERAAHWPADPAWFDQQHPEDFVRWCGSCDIPSIDGHAVRDQYDPAQNTNRDLLSVYDQFLIEIVAETYSQGQCFFPTEKTVRPLSQGRGLLVFGPRFFLQRLRAMGFRTWNTIWDETYDTTDGVLRWRLIQSEMQRIRDLDPAKVDSRLHEIHEHNRRMFDQLVHNFRPQ